MLCPTCDKFHFPPLAKPSADSKADSAKSSGVFEMANAMPASAMIVNEVLNFLKNSFGLSTGGQLKPVLISFYSEEELTVVKTTLHEALVDLGSVEVPRLIARKGDQNDCRRPSGIIRDCRRT